MYSEHYDVSVLDVIDSLKVQRDDNRVLVSYKDNLHIVLNFNVVGKASIDKMYENFSPIILKESYVRRLCLALLEALYFGDGDLIFI
jgi:hypothetical protein